MKALRWLLIGLVLFASACRQQRGAQVHSIAIAQVEYSDEDSATEQIATPERIVLALDVENRGAKAVLREGRLRVSYRGRRVVMFSLDEKVRIDRHSRGEVLVPLKVSVARNSQSVALWQALQRHDAEHITLDWEVAARQGIVSARIVQAAEPLGEIARGERLEGFWQLIDAMVGVPAQIESE